MKLVLLFICSILTLTAFSQTDTLLIFQHDNADNQIKRQLVQEENGVITPLSTTTDISDDLITDKANARQEQSDFQIMAYPAPTTGMVTLSWSAELTKNILRISLATEGGNLLDADIVFTTGKVSYNLRRWPPGAYAFNFYLKDGRIISKTVIKI